MGDTFYRGYYLIHDDYGSKLGIVPHATSMKRAVEKVKVLPTNYIDSSPFWHDFYEGLEGLGALAVVVAIIYGLC
jgi:hypothetical protein